MHGGSHRETERFSPIRPYSPGRPGMSDTDTDENFDDTDIDGVNELRDAIFEKEQQKALIISHII